MLKNKRILQTLLLSVIFSRIVDCQIPNNFPLPKVVPLSPEMHGLGKYGDIPVSTYTGTPDISIPIYTAKSGKLELPIALSYHATGIKVSQEASWVGLGWNLIAGGSVALVDVGGNDMAGYRIPWNDLEPFMDYLSGSGLTHEDYYVYWACQPSRSVPQTVTTNVIMNRLLAGALEPDVYSANFLNKTFKFIKSPKDDSTFTIVGQLNKCKIKRPINTSFKIIDEDGTIYSFDRYELYQTNLTGWYLTEIKNVTGDIITLRYKAAQVSNFLPLNERIIVTKLEDGTGGDNYYPDRQWTGCSTEYQYYLDEIETRNELIKFESDTSRVDLNGALVLKRIYIKDKTLNISKLEYSFIYDYFVGTSTGGNSMYDLGNQGTFPVELFSHRLKLDTLRIGDESDDNYYAFNYYDSISLPYKTSFSMDYWGNFNGQENSSNLMNGSHTLIPNIFSVTIASNDWIKAKVPCNLYFAGANRGASESYITTGMLKSVQYPTKGKTIFEYEPHDFTNARYLSADSINSYTTNFNVFPDTLLYNDNLFSEYDYLGGGVRIKKITNFDENSSIISQKRYFYTDTTGKSSGLLLIPLTYLNYRDFTLGSGDQTWNLTNYISWILSANSYSSLSPLSSGNNVGYSRVTVESGIETAITWNEVSYFYNEAAYLYTPKTPIFTGFENGSLIERINLNSNEDTVTVEKNTYSFLDGLEVSDIKGAYAEDLYSGPTEICVDEGGQVYNPIAILLGPNRFNIYYYPIRNYHSVLSKKEVINYYSTTDSTPSNKVLKTIDYSHNLNNYNVKTIKESTSESTRFLYTKYKYTSDFPSGSIYDNMATYKNQINVPIVKTDSVNNETKLVTTTEYKLSDNSAFYIPSRITTQKLNGSTDERLVYEKYDNYGNLLEARQSNNIKESYYYGYNHSFPVVKGVNIDETALSTKITQSLPSGYTSIDALLLVSGGFPSQAWNTFNNNLRNSCSSCLLTTYTYDPIFGMTSQTDPNGVTTYYEYDSLGRLETIRDNEGKILKTYTYNYIQE